MKSFGYKVTIQYKKSLTIIFLRNETEFFKIQYYLKS